MTTLTELDKLAKILFKPEMQARGFNAEKKFYFWRKRGPLFDVIWPEILSSRKNLRLYVTILSPWIDSEKGEFEKFPLSTCLIGGSLSNGFPEDLRGGLFDIENEKEIISAFEKIIHLIDERVIPWFDSIDSYDGYTSYVGRKGFHPTAEYREKIKRGIARGFELDPI